MGQLPWLIPEAYQRSRLLRAQVEQRRDQAINGPEAEKLHYNQVLTLSTMMETLLRRQDDLLDHLHGLRDAPLSADYRQLLIEITGAQGVWRIFQVIFDQRKQEDTESILNIADLVAYDCYHSCIQRAIDWEVLKNGQFREPPLTYLDVIHSPMAATRTSQIQALGMNIGLHHTERLPIPITILPFDHSHSLWLLTTLTHEVGHHLDQDLHRSGTASISGELRNLILGSALISDGLRRDHWGRWCSEMIADAFGVLLGGAGFVYTLGALVLPLAAVNSIAPESSGVYPPGLVRLHLVLNLIRQIQQPMLSGASDWLEVQMATLPLPNSLMIYIADRKRIAYSLIQHPFAALGLHRLPELVPWFGNDLQKAEDLAQVLQASEEREPTPSTFAFRPVPSAAQLAVARLLNPNEAALQRIHERALAYFAKIPWPSSALNAPAMPSDNHIRQPSEQICFSFDAV